MLKIISSFIREFALVLAAEPISTDIIKLLKVLDPDKAKKDNRSKVIEFTISGQPLKNTAGFLERVLTIAKRHRDRFEGMGKEALAANFKKIVDLVEASKKNIERALKSSDDPDPALKNKLLNPVVDNAWSIIGLMKDNAKEMGVQVVETF